MTTEEKRSAARATYFREYYAANRETVVARKRAHYEANRDKMRARSRQQNSLLAGSARRSWYSMRQRCLDPNSTVYHYYGGRGITICERWDDFNNFLADMGERPAGRTLDRIDGDGNYEPGNCRWATVKEQASNRRFSRRVT